MTEVMNFFESLKFYTSFTSDPDKTTGLRLCVELKNEAQRIKEEADTEWERGEVSHEFVRDAADSNNTKLVTDLRVISVWHFRRASKLFRNASEKYVEAAAIHTKHSKEFINAAKKLVDLSAKAEESAVAIELEL